MTTQSRPSYLKRLNTFASVVVVLMFVQLLIGVALFLYGGGLLTLPKSTAAIEYPLPFTLGLVLIAIAMFTMVVTLLLGDELVKRSASSEEEV